MDEQTQKTSFRYSGRIEGLAEKFGHRSNSLATTYLSGLKERGNMIVSAAFSGSVVMLYDSASSELILPGLPLSEELFEQVAFNIELIYSGSSILVGVIRDRYCDEFAVASANSLGQYFHFQLLKRGETDEKKVV